VLGFAAVYPERVEALVLGGYRDADLDGARAAASDIGRVVDAGVRTLFLVGEQDTVSPSSVTKALQAKIAGSELVIFQTSGHSPYWEVSDEFNRAVLNFLRG